MDAIHTITLIINIVGVLAGLIVFISGFRWHNMSDTLIGALLIALNGFLLANTISLIAAAA